MIKREYLLKLSVIGFYALWTLLVGCCIFEILFPLFSVHKGHVDLMKPKPESKYSCSFMHSMSPARILLLN